MPEFESFLKNEEEALYKCMSQKDSLDPSYDAIIDRKVKWQAQGFRLRAKVFAGKLLANPIIEADDDLLLEKVISRANIVSACNTIAS